MKDHHLEGAWGTEEPPPARQVGDRLRADAETMLRLDGDPERFALWALAVLREQPPEFRRAALDGVMAAMDADEARQS